MFLFMYSLLTFLVLIFEMIRKKDLFIDFLTLFNVFFVFHYCLPAIIFNIEPSMYSEFRFLAIVPFAAQSWMVFYYILLAYIFVFAGFYFAQRFSQNRVIVFKYGLKSQIILFSFVSSISVIGFLMYATAQGGLVNMILFAKDIRAGRLDAGAGQYLTYLADGLNFAMIIFYSMMKYSQDMKIRKICKYLFYFLFILALAYALSTGGRGNIGTVFLLILFVSLNAQKVKIDVKKLLIFIFFIFFIFFLVKYGKSIIWSLPSLQDGIFSYILAVEQHYKWYANSGGDGIYESLVGFASNIDHPIASLGVAIFYPEVYQIPRLGFDWIRAFIDLLPGVSQPDIFINSTPSGLGRDYFQKDGYVPPNWIAMKVINGGFVWLILGSFFAGYIGGWIHKLLINSWNSSLSIPGLYIMLAFFWKDGIVGADPFMVLLPNIMFFIFITTYLFIIKIRKIR